MIVLFWYLVRLLLTAFCKPKPSGGSHAITFGTSTRAGDSLTTVTMKSSNHSDAGSKDYRGGSSSTVGQEDLIPIFLRRLNDLNIRVGTRTRFLIELDDATGVQVRWYHNNVEANSERYQYIHEGGFYCLDIVPVTLFDEGLWVCTAQNYAGKSSTAAHLSLTVPKAFKKPIFVEQLKAVLTQRGIVSLECKVIGVPTPKLRWYKDNKEIKAGDIFALTANSEEDCLGIYTCEATNVMGTALSTSKIQVTHTPLDGNRDADSLIPYGPPPKFMKFLKDASGKVGSVLFLECQVEVPPWPRSIGWYNDNGIVNEGPLYHLMADGLGMYGIEIKSLRADHSTTWKCIATSLTGAKAVTSCVVSVSYPKNYRVPRFLESLRAIMTDEGLVSFECKVIGYPTPQLSWFKDGKQLQPGDVYELTGSKSLGSYCCVARNCMGETSSIAELTIEDIQNQLNESEKLQLTSNTQPPRFLLGLKSIEANINESFVFTIKVTTESTPSISWYKEDEQLTETNRYQFSTEDNGTYMLSILPLEIDDQAEWKCVAINKYGQTVTSSFLKLNIPKTFKSPRFLEELRIAFSNEGSVNLECKVIGVPQPQLKWFKDGQEINPGDMHKIISGQSGTCCLGTYTCQAHNCMGTVSSSATLLTMEDKSTVKSCATEEYLSVGNPLVRNESLSTIPEERTSQMEKSYTIEEPADISFSFDGKEVTVSLYETPDLTHDEALQIIEMYADELSEHISEDNVVDLPSLRIVKESSISGPVMMEALVIDVPIDFCRQQIASDTEFDGVSLTEDITLANNDKSDSICENSLEYFSDHLSSGNSKREVFYSASETTPKNLSMILKQQSVEDEDGHQSFQTPKLFMSDSDDQILTQLKLDERISPQNSRHVIGPFARSESNNTEEEVSETLAEIENEPPLSHNYCASEIVTQSDEDGLYSTVLNKIRGKGMASVALSSEEDDVLKIISRPNVDEFLKYMKIILEGAIVKMQTHENFSFTSTTTELERSIQALHTLAWKFIEETERNNLTDLDKNTADNVSSLMTAINASLLALEQIDDPFGVSDNVLNEIQSSVCFDLEMLNNSDLPASVILDRLSDQIKNFTIVVNRQVTRVTEQRIIAVLRNTIGTTLVYIKTLQQNNSKIKCVDINLLAPLFSMVQPLETILNDIALIEDSSMDDNKPNLKLKQILIPPISSIAFALDNLNTALKSDSSNDDQDLKDIYDRINESTNQFMIIASQGMDSNKIAECFISFTKPINDLCCHLRRLGRSTENIVSSDYGSDDKLLLDFETLFDELMMDIDTLINNVNFVQDSENNMNPLGSLLEPLQDMKIGLFQVNQVLLSNQTGSTMSYEVVSCFEHLSQQLVQLNNCIVNQSIVEETDKEIPFESSIKMMQNILFDDAIDDLGVNGILFGSVMKPLLQLQNLIVSKMASVESDLSFSEHTDVTGGACDTQSLSLSLSNNAQTVFNKNIDKNSKNGLTESSIIDNDCDNQNNIHTDNSEINKDSIHFENNVNNDLVIKRGFECDIGETFKYEEPNIITSEDDRDNSGFEALFDETDLETISDFVEDRCMDNIINSQVDDKLSDLFMSDNDIETVKKEINDIIPEHILESLEKNNQQNLILNSSVDLFDELQDTLKNMSEVAQDKLTETYTLDNNTSNINDLQKNNLKYDDQLCDKINNLLDNSLDVAKLNNSTIIRSDELTKQNIIELSEINSEELNQCNKIILKTDQDETLKNKNISINDQDIYKEEKVFEIGQVVDLVDNLECFDSDKSISNNTIITVNEISESSEIKIKEVDNTENLETTDNLMSSTTENVSQIVGVSDENSSIITSMNNVVSKIIDNDEALTNLSDIKNEILDSVLSDKSNFTESIENIKFVSNEDIVIDANKLSDSGKLNLLNYDYDTENKDAMLRKNSDESFQQDNTVLNDIDSIHNLETDKVIQEAQTSIGNILVPIDKSINSEELNKVLATLVDEKNDLTVATNLLIEDPNTSFINEPLNETKQCDNRDLINKSICTTEDRETSTKEPTSSIDSINLMTAMENNIIKGTTEIQDSNNEKLSLLKYEYNDSGAFEIDQDIDSDNISHNDIQPNINTTSTTDNEQSVTNSPICESIVNPTTEPNVHQTEEYIQNSSNQFIDEIQNEKNESELNNEETIENVQQKNILELSNNEVKSVDELNEQCEILSEMKLNNEIEYINSKIVLSTEIICQENVIDTKNVVEQCVIDKSNHIDGLCTTQYNIDKYPDIILPVTEVMTEKTESNILEKQLVITNKNVEENKDEVEKSKQNRKVCENSSENNDIIDNTGTKFKTDVTNNFENSVNLTLNEKEISSDKKINSCSENEITEISMNNEDKYINTLKNSFKNSSENTQPIDPYTLEEKRIEIQFKENINSGNEHTTVLYDKDQMIINLELLESKNEILCFPDETINNDVEKSCCEIEYIQNDSSKKINELPNIMAEQTTALVCNKMISVSNVEMMDSVVIDFKNIKEQNEIELNVPDFKNIEVLENTIDTIDKINRQNDDEEKMSNDESISKLLNTNNLIYDENKEKSITKEYNEKQTTKLIDEKSNSDSYKDDVKNSNDILKAMNNLNTKNKEENIQSSDENKIKVSLTKNDLITTIIDMETSKTKTDNEVDSSKIIASENDLGKHKSSFLVDDNTEDCKEITSYPNMCNEISNENNINQSKHLTECQTKAILENFDTLENNSHKESKLSNTISNEEKSSRIDSNLEIIETSECLLFNKDIDCKIMESPNIDFSVDESLQIDTDIDIIAEQNNTSKSETPDMSVYSMEKVNVMNKDYLDKNPSVGTNSTFEVHGNSSNTINDNEENEQSTVKLESINADENILINEIKIINQIDIKTAVENNVNLLNDTIFEDGVNDLNAKESLSSLSIMPKLHCIEKIAANQTECVMLENTNILKQKKLNAKENVNQYAQVEHELNIAAIGNIIIDYDSVKEHSITSDDEKNSIENATIALNLDNNSFKILSTVVDVSNVPTNDTIITNEQTVMNEASKDSISTVTLLSENKNTENLMVVVLNDETENSDNFFEENVQSKIESMNKPTEISIDNDLEIENTKRRSNKKKSSLPTEDKKSPSPDKTIKDVIDSEKEIDKTKNTDKSIEEKNKVQSDDKKDTEKVEVELSELEPKIPLENNKNTEEVTEKDVLTDDQNKNQKVNKIDNGDIQITENEIELNKTKRGSKKKKASLPSEDKKSPSPDKTIKDIIDSEKEIDKTKNIDKSIEEKNKVQSDDKKDTEKVEVELSELEPKIPLENNKNTEEVTEKDVLTDDQNKNQKVNKIDNGDIQITENEIELNKTKRGSKKKKASLPSEDKKSPSPDKTIKDIIDSEKEIDKTKNIDKSIEEKNKVQSDDKKDTEKVEVELSELEPKIPLENNKNTEEVTEKDVLTDDQNKNQKVNKIDNDDVQITESEIELNKIKRGSKKKKASLPSEDKKSPSPDKTIKDVIYSEKEIDKTKNIDKSIEEKNKVQSDDKKDTEKVEVELSELEPKIPLENNKNTEEVTEKDVLTDDQNKNQKVNKIDNGDIQITENEIELNKTKRGSKKKKASLPSEDKKSPSPDKTIKDIIDSEKEIDKTKNIDKSIEEKNKVQSDDKKDTEKVEVELSELEPKIPLENNKNTEEVTEKDVLTDDQNKNQKVNKIDNDDVQITESEIELNKIKRGSKKKKASLPSEDKKSPSPDKTIKDVIYSEKEIDKTKNIDKSIEEKNKVQSDDKKDTEKVEVELSELEPKIPLENNKNTEEVTEKDVLTDDQNKNQKVNKLDNDDVQITESEIELNKTKRGSKKKKASLPSEDKKSPSPDKTIKDVIYSEKEIDKTKNIDKSIEEKSKVQSDDKKDTEKVEVELSELEPKIPLENNKNTEEVTEKDVLTDDQNKNQKVNKIDNGDIQITENEIELNKTKRGSKKKKASLPSEDKKLPSPDKTIKDIIDSEKEIDKTKNIDKSIEEKNKVQSDDKKDTEKVEVELSELEPKIPLENNKNTEEVTEKDVLTDDQNKNQKVNKIDNDDVQITESEIELNKIKRGSKKKKASLPSEDKKSPSPDKTIKDVIYSEKEIDKTKNIDKSIEEKNKVQSDDKKDTEKVEVELSELEPKIPLENNKNTEEVTEKDVLTDDQNKNQKVNKLDNDDVQITESEIELNKTKRGSKKKKASLPSEDKKSPSPDKTIKDVIYSEKEIDKTKNIDKSIEEKSKVQSDDKKDTEKVEVELSELEPKIPLENNKNTEEVTEKDVLTDDQNKNQKVNKIDNDDVQITESEIELNKTKRGSKKKKASLPSEDKKSPSPDKTIKDVIYSEKEIDKTKNIDKSIEEKNKVQSDDKKDTEKVEVELSELEPKIPLENNKNIEEVTEKDVLTDDQNKNQKVNKIDNDDVQITESEIELNKTKRGSKKKKASLPSEDKKSPSPDKTIKDVIYSEKEIDKTKNIDKSIEEKNKVQSDDKKDTEKVEVELSELEPKIPLENNKNTEEVTEKDVLTDDQNKNQKVNKIDNGDIQITENEIELNKTKRGSKKKKASLPSEDKKSPSPDKTIKDIIDSEKEIDKTKNIDKSIEEKNKVQSDDKKDTEKVEVELSKLEPKIPLENNKNTEEVTEKDVLTDDQNKNQKSNKIDIDDNLKSTKNNVELVKTKRGSKKNESRQRVENKKSPSPEKTKNKKLSDNNIDTEKLGTKLESEVPVESNIIKAEEFEYEILIEDTKQKYEKEFIEINIENDEKKRETKEKKRSSPSEINKSSSSDTIKNDSNVNKTINEACEDNNTDIEKEEIKLDKSELKITIDDNNRIDADDYKVMENEKDKKKRGSKKNKISPEPIIEKLSSPDTTKNNISVIENKIKTTIIDETFEDNDKQISEDNKHTEQVGTEVKSKTTTSNDKNIKERIEKDVSNNTQIKNQNNDNIGKDDEIKSIENFVEKDGTKRGSKRDALNSRPQGKKSTSPDKTKEITENLKIQSRDENNTIIELEQLENKRDDSKILRESKQTLQCKEIKPSPTSRILSINNYESVDSCRSEISPDNNSRVGMDRKQMNETRSFVDALVDDGGQRIAKKELKSTGLVELDNVGVPEIPSLGKRPVNRYMLDVTDAHKLRPTTLAYRSLTPDPLTSYRSPTPDHFTSYRSLTPDCPSYKSYLTPRTKYTTSTKYAGSSDRELYGGSSSSRSSRSSSRSMSPYPSESRISTRNLWPTSIAAYRCLSETSVPLSSRLLEEEKTSGWLHTSYGTTTRRRRGSDSFLHDSGVRDGDYYSSWRLSNSRSAAYGATEDLCRTKEAFKSLYFCVRMIDQTVSSGARVKFWCSVIGHPEPRVQWYRDGQKLNSFTYNSSARYQTKYDGGLAQLIIDNAQSGDSGEYTCVAANSSDRISTTGFLTVYTSPSVFRKPLLQPSLSVDSLESGREAYTRTSHDLRLPANARFDFGCRKFGSDLVSRCPEYPKFVSSIIADDVATCGGTIALQVRVQGSPVPNVTWMRESRPLPRLSGKYVYLDEGGLYTLLVMDSTARDGGTYVCRACNLYGVADAEKAVSVVSPQDYSDRRGVKPAIIVSRPNDRLNVAVGEDITVTLRVAGEPKPKVIWMRGSRDVTFFDRSSKETVNDYVMLSIKKAQPSDAGTYFIIAKNVYGSDRAFVTVGVRERARSLTPPRFRNTIGRWSRPIGGRGGRGGCANNEVPGPVRSEPTVTDRTNNRISLQWDRPEKPETVLVYRVETRTEDEECWRPVGMTPTNTIDVYNLKPGYRYQFRVAARNRFGWSQSVAAKGYVDVFEPKCLPEFRQPLPGQTRVLLHHSATLQCHVRGVPEPRVTWFKDGEPLLASDRHAVRRTDIGKCTLTIEDAVEEDAGRYSCEAVNDQGRVCTLTVVQVIANRRIVEAERRLQGCLMKNNNFKESAPVFTKYLIDRRVEINSTVRLSCQVNGLPMPLVLWYKDGQPLDFSGGTEGDKKPPVRDDSDDFYTLELTGVKYDDSGAYAAVASNAIGKASTRCVLEVFNKNRTDPAVPTFIFGLPTTSEAVDSIVLSAQIDAFRPVKVEWFRDGIQLRNGRRVDIITDHDGNLELRIACVTTRDSGTYMLRVSNDTGTVESRCDVNVVEREHNDTGMEQISLINHLYSKKPKFVVKPKFQEVEEGQEVIIDSEIVGDPLPKITWLRDGLKPEYYRDNSEFLCISNRNRYQLKIPHAKLTHTGTYTLLATNPHGQIKALISLQVYSTGHCKKKMENGTNHATVERLPRISRGLVDIECRENDGVTFECKLNITQETDIRWQKDGKLVRLGKQIKSQLIDGDTARLEISTVSPLHEGLYTCTAFNELGQDSTSARLILLSDSQETAKVPQSNGQQNAMIGSPILAGESNDRCTKRLKRSSAPKFYAVLHDRIADIGETVRFQCSVSGHPPPWSSWEKDGQPIGVNSRMRIREDDDYRSLEICDVTSDDAGLYRITVENKFGKIQATARLEVLTHNQITNDVQITSSSNGRRQSGSAACAGENFTLSCDIRGNSMSDVTWYKNDVEVKPDDRVTSSLDDLAARLSISNLESADTGVYTCVARCESGVTRCSTELCVFDTKPGTDSYLQPPIFVEGLVPKRTADEGEPVQLTVRLQGAVPMSALWFKNDVLVPNCTDFEYVVTEDRGEFGLSIIDPFVKDSGIYSCKVANSFGQAVSSGKLIINEMSSGNQVPMVIELNNNMQDVGEKTACDSPVNIKAAVPASILSGPYDTTVLRGAKVVLKTSYKGDPEPCVQWLRAGKVLESDAHLCITNERGVSSLTIDSITADDCGKYVVRVDNGHGNDFHFASVAVEGPPDPPAGRPVVSVSETSADVTWSSPAYDGGCMVTGYGVEVRPFNQSDWKLVADKCHSLSHIVRGLAPGESYVFRVRAENMHGSSEASLESTPVYILQTDYGNTLWPKTVNIENGDLFDKQYEMLDELGKGRYGVVYKVKERETNKYYAAKFVRCIKSTDKEKAQEEVDIMNCLRHPKLLQLDAAFDKPREVVLVTEYISGGELFERVVADDFTLTEKDCILFTRQICEGVDYMHKQNVVHLDLKPENIMCQSRTSHYIKLIDFGLAQKIIPGQPMRVLFGTPEFIPPEIIGYEPIGFESDMWSVGVICYVLLSGLSPFMGDNDSETFTNITKAEFDFDDEAFDAVSQDAKDFISALLIKRKELRLTARECLKHKWLAQQDMDMSCVILSTDKLKKFIIRRKWQKTGNAIRALGRMATLSAASRRGVVGSGSVGGGVGGGTADGNGARSILQKLKMTSLKEEESTVESPSEGQEITITETAKSGSCHKACDDRSDSGFSECPSVASPIAMLVRTPECPSIISEEIPPVSNPYRSPPPPTRRSPPTITDRHSSPANLRPSSPATFRPSSPANLRPSSPATLRPSSPATRRTFSPANHCPSKSTTCSSSSPATHGSSSSATRGLSSPAVHGPSYPATRGSSHTTHPRSPLPRNRHDTTHPIHDVPLPTGTGVSVLKTNRMIFDSGRRDGSASSAGMSASGGVQRKEPIRLQTTDNFKKAVAFWKQ